MLFKSVFSLIIPIEQQQTTYKELTMSVNQTTAALQKKKKEKKTLTKSAKVKK